MNVKNPKGENDKYLLNFGFNHISKEKSLMSYKKPEKKQTMARILALIIAGIMTLSVVIAVIINQ